MWAEKLDWPFEPVEGGFRDPQGPEVGDTTTVATAIVFAVAPSKVLAFGKGEPFSQTRYRFG